MRRTRPAFALFILLLAALACNLPTGEDEPTATPVPPTPPLATNTVPAPTDAPPPVATNTVPSPTEPPPTKPPQTEGAEPTDPPPAAVLELSGEVFSHPDGLFEINVPVGWEAEPDVASASIFAPDDSGLIQVEITNTGLFLDDAAFENFIDANDTNFFGTFDGYTLLNREIDHDQDRAWTTKRLNFDGVPQIVTTVYDQWSEIIYTIDFWADADLEPAYRDTYDQVFDTFDPDPGQALEVVDLYYWIYEFYGPGDLFSIEVPTSWRYELTEGDVAIVDTFYSPDDHAIIQNIAYDDGTAVSRSEAGAFALELLRTNYATDIVITNDQVQPDGSERLTWNSPSGDYSGISFLETRGTTFLLFSVLWDNPFEDVYYEALDYTIGSYIVPE